MFQLFSSARACALALGVLSLSGSLLMAQATPQTTFTGSITLTSSQTNDYFVYDANNGALQGTKSVGLTNSTLGVTGYVPAGTFAFNESIPSYISSGTATALGLYSANGVSIAVNQATYNAALNTETWDQVFAGTPESSVVTDLQGGDSASLVSFLQQYSNDFISFSSATTTPTSGGILHFSNAADGGSITFSAAAVGGPTPTPTPTSATPEPSTMLLLVSGMSVLALAARKLRKS